MGGSLASRGLSWEPEGRAGDQPTALLSGPSKLPVGWMLWADALSEGGLPGRGLLSGSPLLTLTGGKL